MRASSASSAYRRSTSEQTSPLRRQAVCASIVRAAISATVRLLSALESKALVA
ncbi:MAG: hypothetical protein ACLPYS_19350 [Vulcanimicrobiaceae bacterium]